MEGSPTASVSLDVVVLAALSDLSRQFSVPESSGFVLGLTHTLAGLGLDKLAER